MIAFGDISIGLEAVVQTFVAATDGQNDYTLLHEPAGNVAMSHNGQTLPETAYSVLGRVVTFNPAGTGSNITAADSSDSTIKAGANITIQYLRRVQ